ncbi:MAG: MMPL family transporter, partial [Candidatus Methanoperedens sp.]|nr:MMPL family transporter [Candidatus Methanoperedens sp.]
YFSKDYTMALIRIQTTDDVDLNNLEDELSKILKEIPAPPGINAQLGGTVLEGQVMSKSIGPDMAKTTTYSLVGILMVILILFRSVKYGFTPLTTIIFGSLWAMGYVGLIGLGLTSQTSGVLSMIMGIGIDFGIQVVTRYRLELTGRTPQEAMTISLNNVIVPMSTTTLAALIGFKAMSLGKLTFLADMGTIMAYGVVASMFAAITVVPALIVILDSMDIKNTIKKLIDRFEVRT